MTDAQCIACPFRAVQRHHVVYEQELRARFRGGGLDFIHSLAELTSDARNLVPVCKRCHERHHTRFHALPLHGLPDSAFEFAAELMGNGPAFEYLKRRYTGTDPRLDALLKESAA